jgi:hypothetical protein
MLSLFFKGMDSVSNQEDSSSMMHIESEMMDSNSGRKEPID